MSKIKILILTLVILILAIVTMSEVDPEKDKKMIKKAIEDVFNVYNNRDDNMITSILHKYINPDQCKLVFNDMIDDMNSIMVNGIVIYKDGFDLRNNKFTLGDYDIYIISDKAAVTGYVDGSVSIPGKEVEKGPWKISSGMYKRGDRWFISYIKLTKVDMIKLEYYPQLPKNYGKDPNKKWPLIVFLHGVGERGGTLEDVKKMNHSIPMMAETSKDFPFVAVSPLCPQSFSWKDLPYSISNMIDEVIVKYNIDTDRIYLTGLSMGGIGTWSIALQFPDKFAAIAPVCGSVDPDKVEKLKNLPIWAFHGAKDTVVSMGEEQKAVNVLKSCGSNIKYTVYPDVEHDSWSKAYPDKKLYAWFLQHTRAKNKSQK
jgi:predicted esterase